MCATILYGATTAGFSFEAKRKPAYAIASTQYATQCKDVRRMISIFAALDSLSTLLTKRITLET
jgi:hypothetical protein